MKHLTSYLSILLVLTSCGESKEDLYDQIDDLESQVTELKQQLSEKDYKIKELEEQIYYLQSVISDAEYQ